MKQKLVEKSIFLKDYLTEDNIQELLRKKPADYIKRVDTEFSLLINELINRAFELSKTRADLSRVWMRIAELGIINVRLKLGYVGILDIINEPISVFVKENIDNKNNLK